MSKPFSTILWIIGILTGAVILLGSGFLVFLSVTEFSPPMKMKPVVHGKGKPMDPSLREFTFLTWNTGYAGLGPEMDFFYDGGKQVRPAKEQCNRYFDGIKRIVLNHEMTDFIFLQEVDVHSKRSWYCNEFAALSAILPDFSCVFAPNYDCRFVPVPLNDPMGRVVSGIASYFRMEPKSAEVHYFNSRIPWPKRLVYLKRCYLLIRYSLDSGKDLVILNTHNSAYDSTGAWRKNELAILASAMEAEYKLGNYVVAGGDWNNNPRGYNGSTITSGDQVTSVEPGIEPTFLPGWQFVFDPDIPSNRDVDMPYKKGVTKTTIIDYFVISPNVEVKSVATISTEFAFSDHQPVEMGVRLK